MEEKRQQADLAETLLDDGSHRVQSMQHCARVAGKGIIGILLMIQICASFKYFMRQMSSTAPLVSLEGQTCNIRQVSFSMKLDGTVLRGTLLQPKFSSSTNKVPALIMTNGFGATANLGGGKYVAGSHCDQAGFAVLNFDFRSFGYSDGEPRCVVNWWDNLDAYRDALDFMESQEFVDKDRLVISGDSWAGALSLNLAAIDPRVKALIVGTPGPLIANISDHADANAFASYKQPLLERSYAQAASIPIGPVPLVKSDPNSIGYVWMGIGGLISFDSQVDVHKADATIRDFYLAQGAMDPSWRNETTFIQFLNPSLEGTAALAVHFVYQPVQIHCSREDEFTHYEDCLRAFGTFPSKDKELQPLMGGHVGSGNTDRPHLGDRPPAFYDRLGKEVKFLKRLFL